jgi:hypothetical protein
MSFPFNHTGHFSINISVLMAQMARAPAITMSTTKEKISLENRLPIMVTFISLYALIFFFGICGNALVVRKYYLFIRIEKQTSLIH